MSLDSTHAGPFRAKAGQRSFCLRPERAGVNSLGWQPGKAGTTIRRCHCWRPGSFWGKPGGGKIQTAALTVPVLRVMIAGLLDRMLLVHSQTRITPTANRRLKRNEEARLSHWRQRKRLPPLRFDQRT